MMSKKAMLTSHGFTFLSDQGVEDDDDDDEIEIELEVISDERFIQMVAAILALKDE